MADKSAEINITVTLDSQQVPKDICWIASDAGFTSPRETRSFIMSVWDTTEKRSLSMGLWTPEMTVGDMNIQMFETMMNMADTYERATQNEEISLYIRDLADKLAKKISEFNKFQSDQIQPPPAG